MALAYQNKREVLKFADQLVVELHKTVGRNFGRRVNVNGIVDIWVGDLIDMQTFKKNKGIFDNGNRYIF